MGAKRRKSATASQPQEDEPSTSGREHSAGAPRSSKRSKPSVLRGPYPIEPGAFYALRVNVRAGPIVPLAFEKDVFLKLHSADDGLPKDRTLFVAGLPFVLAGPALAELLSVYGPIEKAAIHPDQVCTRAFQPRPAHASRCCAPAKYEYVRQCLGSTVALITSRSCMSKAAAGARYVLKDFRVFPHNPQNPLNPTSPAAGAIAQCDISRF